MPDVNIRFIDRQGVRHNLQAPTDMSMNLMELVRAYELAEDGTIGVCGGMAMCASCQVYILEGEEKLPLMQSDEDAMLSEAWHVQDNSRLGCQIPITEELEGLSVQLAPYP